MLCLITLSRISQMEQKTLSKLGSVPGNTAYTSGSHEKTTILAVFREFLNQDRTFFFTAWYTFVCSFVTEQVCIIPIIYIYLPLQLH